MEVDYSLKKLKIKIATRLQKGGFFITRHSPGVGGPAFAKASAADEGGWLTK